MPEYPETRPIRLVPATPADAELLAIIQGRAFHDDVRFVKEAGFRGCEYENAMPQEERLKL